MPIEKTLVTLHTNIICEHKKTYYDGDFFHNHDGYEILLLLNGQLNYYMEQQGVLLERGDLVCIKPYDFHRRKIDKNTPYERIVISIKDTFMNTLSTRQTDLSACFHSAPAGKSSIFRLSEQEIMEYSICAHSLSRELGSGSYGSDILSDIYIKKILIMLNQFSNEQKHTGAKNIMPSLVSNTIAYIEEHLVEKITLDILADYFHHNGTYISRCFKKIAGISLQQYIIRKRITLAKKYLSEGRAPYDTCYLSGFNDYSNFSRTFTKHVGTSPKKFQSS